jgi:hypothetical protein
MEVEWWSGAECFCFALPLIPLRQYDHQLRESPRLYSQLLRTTFTTITPADYSLSYALSVYLKHSLILPIPIQQLFLHHQILPRSNHCQQPPPHLHLKMTFFAVRLTPLRASRALRISRPSAAFHTSPLRAALNESDRGALPVPNSTLLRLTGRDFQACLFKANG